MSPKTHKSVVFDGVEIHEADEYYLVEVISSGAAKRMIRDPDWFALMAIARYERQEQQDFTLETWRPSVDAFESEASEWTERPSTDAGRPGPGARAVHDTDGYRALDRARMEALRQDAGLEEKAEVVWAREDGEKS